MLLLRDSATTMSVLLLSFLGVSMGSHCPIWKEITPCTCWMESASVTTIFCDRMQSFDQVVAVLRGKFLPSDRVSLWLQESKLDDLPYRRFTELNMTIENLKLNYDNIEFLEPNTFEGLQNSLRYLSIADNRLGEVPDYIWWKVPNIGTLDLGRVGIREVTEASFKNLLYADTIMLAGNSINRVDTNAIPPHVRKLHLGRNNINDLNKTLTRLTDLDWLFINGNQLTTLEDELPYTAPSLRMIHVSDNYLAHLPQSLRNFPLLETLFARGNLITSLDGALAKSRELKRCVLEHNRINTLTEDDFTETEMLASLFLGHNQIKVLNNSLLNLRSLKFLNLTDNLLTHFSFQDIMGLEKLQSLDLSHNKITTITGPAANLVDWNIKLAELKLDHNELETLNGALSGLPVLLRLNLSHNKLQRISPDDFIGLDQLRLLDVSYNYLTTLEEMSTTFLPRLEELRASNNLLTILDKDFHGLPVLCHADLSSNQIVALGRDLVSKTRCKIGHGIHEGAWDTLKIYLQDNPIICDAAFPEISSAMEVNHTRIYGVAHCPPLSEQPITSKPNGFLGYVPDTTQSLPAAIAANQATLYNTQNTQPVEIKPLPNTGQIQPDNTNNLQVYPVSDQNGNRRNEQYEVDNAGSVLDIQKKPVNRDVPTTLNVDNNQNIDLELKNSDTENSNGRNIAYDERKSSKRNTESQQPVIPYVDPVKQEQQLTQLASEIEVLRTKIEVLATQNQLLLQQQLHNKTDIGNISNNAGQVNGIEVLDDIPINQKEEEQMKEP